MAVLTVAVVVVVAVLLRVSVTVVVMVGLVNPLRFEFLWTPIAHEARVIGSG